MICERGVRPSSGGGFTLVELMIVVGVVALLMVIALPSFNKQVLKGHRSAAQAQMLEIANRQEQFLLANRAYSSDLTELGYVLPADIAERYDPTITVDNSSVPSYLIQFEAINSQVNDGGPLTLTNLGAKTPADLWD